METFPSEFAGTPKGSVQCQVNAEKAKVLTERRKINETNSLEQKVSTCCILKFKNTILFCISSCWISLVASPGAATFDGKEAIPRRTGLGVKTKASAQAIDCLKSLTSLTNRDGLDGLCRLSGQSEVLKLFLPLLC